MARRGTKPPVAAAATPDPLPARVAELERLLAEANAAKKKFQRLTEEACLDALQAVLVRFGCKIQGAPGGMVEVIANE